MTGKYRYLNNRLICSAGGPEKPPFSLLLIGGLVAAALLLLLVLAATLVVCARHRNRAHRAAGLSARSPDGGPASPEQLPMIDGPSLV